MWHTFSTLLLVCQLLYWLNSRRLPECCPNDLPPSLPTATRQQNVVPALDEDEPFDAQADPDEQYDGGVLGAAGRRRRAAAAAAARAAEGEVLGAEEAGEAGRVLQPPPASEESHAVQVRQRVRVHCSCTSNNTEIP